MKILIIGPAWVGDMVMAQTLFICLRQRYPNAVIDVLAPDWTRPLLERMPEINQAISMPVGHGKLALGSRRTLGKALQKESYQQTIVLPNSFKSALIPLFAKIPVRTGWRGEARSWLLNDCRILNKEHYPLMIQRFAALGFPVQTRLPEELPYPALMISEETIADLKIKFELELNRPVLILCPGAEFGASKKWPEAYYAEVAEAAVQQGQQVWVLGSSNDEAGAEMILQAVSAESRQYCRSFAGKTVLAQAIDLMSLAAAVVSNDSGLMHIAAALGKPLVVVYGSTSPEFTPPLARQVRIVSLGLSCSPCFKRDCPLQHLRCLKDLKPAKVLQALDELKQ